MKKKAYLSALAGKSLTDFLSAKDFEPVLLTGIAPDGNHSPVYEAVSTHADIHMCRLGLWEDPPHFHGKCLKAGKK